MHKISILFQVTLAFFCWAKPDFVSSNHKVPPCSCPYATTAEFLLQEWRLSKRMVMLGSCTFWMGSNKTDAIPGDGETPARLVKIEQPFWVDKTEVARQDFSQFVDSTKYKTTAEELGTSFVFAPRDGQTGQLGTSPGNWWVERKAISWRTGSNKSTGSHPVTHVSWHDAIRFCNWKGGTLPTEPEWEFACRGGFHRCLYPWGNKLKPTGTHMTNIWQGRFPIVNTAGDGFEETSPVGSFPPNQFGLYDVSGNVWEWILDAWSVDHPEVRIQKGGSFMCHRLHCFRYRCGARTKGSSDSTSSNLGFRCVQQVRGL